MNIQSAPNASEVLSHIKTSKDDQKKSQEKKSPIAKEPWKSKRSPKQHHRNLAQQPDHPFAVEYSTSPSKLRLSEKSMKEQSKDTKDEIKHKARESKEKVQERN